MRSWHPELLRLRLSASGERRVLGRRRHRNTAQATLAEAALELDNSMRIYNVTLEYVNRAGAVEWRTYSVRAVSREEAKGRAKVRAASHGIWPSMIRAIQVVAA